MAQIVSHAGLNMAKPVAAEVFAAIPTGHHDEVVLEALAFEHPKDHHSCTGFAIVVFDRGAVQNNRPRVMGSFGKFLVLFECLEGALHVFR